MSREPLFSEALRIKIISNSKMDDIISITVCPLAISPLALYYVTWDPHYMWMFLYAASITWITELIKRNIVRYSGNPVLKRPRGAYNCGAFNNGGNSEYKPGFPSGHVALATFLTCAYGHDKHILFQLLEIGYIGSVSYARMNKRCHNLLQVLGGACLGLIAYILFDSHA